MKAGRLLMIGFEGIKLPIDFEPLIKKYGIGGFVLFDRNLKDPGQIIMLNQSLHGLEDGFTPIIAVDQEGGRVQRLKHPFTRLPSAKKIGESYIKHNDIKLMYEYGKMMADELSMAGFNMNLMPVIDLSIKEDGVIGDRAFSDDVLIIEEIGASIIAGMQDNGIIACAKHFPGHTDTQVDPHKESVSININMETLTHHIRPFIHVAKNYVGSIMASHTIFKAVDDAPVSISNKFIHGILRKEIGFNGIIITDDMKMGAISKHYTPFEALVNALNADADMIMLSNTTPQEFESIMQELDRTINNGMINKDRIEASLLRIDTIKKFIGIKEQMPASINDLLSLFNDKTHIEAIKRL